MSDLCPCGSKANFDQCCGPYLSGDGFPSTAEKLMKSRYTAYAKGDISYIKSTLAPESRKDFDEAATQRWSQGAQWKGLKIISTNKGSELDKKGTVEFMATYQEDRDLIDHHEVSRFRRSGHGRWMFVDGDSHTHKHGEPHHHHHPVKPATVLRESAKVGRNDPCSCGSGKKYKKCCGA